MIPEYPITSLHQIELTSRCNLRCRYCPSPHLGREKMDMSAGTFDACLNWAAYFSKRGTQRELNLAGIGESTLHPNFAAMVLRARKVLGWDIALTMATNGILVTEELAQEIAPAKPLIWVSLHRPEKAGPAVEILRKYGLCAGVSADPSIAANDWAGQVKWFNSAAPMACPWVTGGRVFAMADGRVSPCCIDASGCGVIGTVFDDVSRMATRPYELCRTCAQHLAIPEYDQRAGQAEVAA